MEWCKTNVVIFYLSRQIHEPEVLESESEEEKERMEVSEEEEEEEDLSDQEIERRRQTLRSRMLNQKIQLVCIYGLMADFFPANSNVIVFVYLLPERSPRERRRTIPVGRRKRCRIFGIRRIFGLISDKFYHR